MPPPDSSTGSGRNRPCRPIFGTGLCCLFLAIQGLRGEVARQFPGNPRVLTNTYDIWQIPSEERGERYRIHTEVLIYYFDPKWDVAWGECHGTPAYLPVADSPVPLHAGDRVAIDGIIVPKLERFLWDETRVRVLESGLQFKAKPVARLDQDPDTLKSRLISVSGLIDRLTEDQTHLTLILLSGNFPACVYILKETNAPPRLFKEGDFVRLNGVCSPQFDRDGKLSAVALWVAGPQEVRVIGSLSGDARFNRPVTSADHIGDSMLTNDLLHVEGVVRSHEPGKWVTLWDATGQVMVESKQTMPLRVGDRVEAVGIPYVLGIQVCLRNSLYRPIATNQAMPTPLGPSGNSPLRLAEQIRDLSRTEAALHPRVQLRAIVAWSHPATPFAYVIDASGGVRLANPKWEGVNSDKPGTIVTVKGEVAEGGYVPLVTNAVVSRVGWWSLEAGEPVTLEQALTGVENGRWVEIRGYLRRVTPTNRLVRFELSTSGGEFLAWTPATQSFDYLVGSIVRVRGVCAAIANPRHQLTGIEIWAPKPADIQVEEPAPWDVFAAPKRPLGSLRRFNWQNALNQRVLTFGTVVLHVPGRYLYVQDGLDSVFALSQQTDPLQPGDRVEVVGFPGNQGRRFLLREAVYRRLSRGPEPTPVRLTATHAVNVDLEGLLATAEGTLLNVVVKDGETRLLIQAGESTFEAGLDAGDATDSQNLRGLALGSRLAVAGVYEVQSDEYGKPNSYVLRLRSLRDVRVLRRPPWWTLPRLAMVLLGVLAVSALGLVWGYWVCRKNRLLRHAQAELQAANDQLERRVEERTRELQEQVEAKERARAELAEAQVNLMLTSRQAGMAEVATGVLHNVGNVLNSVNVSAGLLGERLRHLSVESVARTAALLHEHQARLGRFFTEDSKGKALPGYLEKLGEVLLQDKREMQTEVESLVKNIDHIKVIVSMQQSYARVSGVLEEISATDLTEDAIQINAATLDRHRIRVVREYHQAPRALVDRHKVLQILVNLINNAKHALSDQACDRRVTVAISHLEPDRVRISVSDNGVGIAPENLNRVFSQGFTTRKDGHGFGLHSGANAARELGGSLTVHSGGVGCGATFTLDLPTVRKGGLKPAPGPTVIAAPA